VGVDQWTAQVIVGSAITCLFGASRWRRDLKTIQATTTRSSGLRFTA
jgi:hypothetical protein